MLLCIPFLCQLDQQLNRVNGLQEIQAVCRSPRGARWDTYRPPSHPIQPTYEQRSPFLKRIKHAPHRGLAGCQDCRHVFFWHKGKGERGLPAGTVTEAEVAGRLVCCLVHLASSLRNRQYTTRHSLTHGDGAAERTGKNKHA
jgi:hypothetical protein